MQHCYECWWREFTEFACETSREALPVDEETVGCFFVQLDLESRGGGMQVAAVAITMWHVREGLPNPCGNTRVRLVINGTEWAWSAQSPKWQRDPFLIKALQAWVQGLKFSGGSVVALQDACLVAVGLHMMCQALELAALQIEDVKVEGKQACM
jgi:hypothetical protein